MDESVLSNRGMMAMIDLIVELLWRATLFLGLLYAVDYALDGKLDLPARHLDWEELRIVKWGKQLLKKIKLLKKGGI